jgi:uncharacterized protein (TIGR00288 family)
MAQEPLIAVFVDFENLALGVHDVKGGKKSIQIDLVLKRLLEKGRIVFKRAYCDWSRYQNAVRELHQHGIELIDIPQTKFSGKNSADIHMVVDALDLCYAKQHIDVFALLTGDSDFSPLVSKLKENDKRVVGCGVKKSTSTLLINGCDEFIYYDDLVRARTKTGAESRRGTGEPDKKQEALAQVETIVGSLEQEYEPLWGSMVKQALRRVNPSFSESYFGYRNFAELLEDAEEREILELDFDEDRGNYQVRLRKRKAASRGRRSSGRAQKTP